MKSHFLPSLFCSAVLLTAHGAHAKPKPLEVSKDNFVSLQWSRSGGFAGISESYTIQNHELLKRDGRGAYGGGFGQAEPESLPQVAPLSENQWKQLLAQLKAVKIPAIAGTYTQPHLADGFNESLVLTLSNGANRDQKFSVSNTGDKAPATYYKFTAYLSALLHHKFNPTPVSASPSASTPATR
jgi:hypothetical protein